MRMGLAFSGAVTFGIAVLGACDAAHGVAGVDGQAAPPVDSAPSPPPVDAAIGGPYPIVLAHGLFGFANIGPLDYWYGIPPVLEAQGRNVYVSVVDPVQTSDVRGAQLVANIETAKQMFGAQKVIVIGHSQGGLDARWAAANDPDSIAAVITIATPHRGSPVADVAAGLVPGDAEAALDAIADLFGISSTSFEGALATLTTTGAAAFNAQVQDVKGIRYWSVAGRSNLATSDECPPSSTITQEWDSSNDPMNPVLLPLGGILDAAVSPETPVQDGLVTLDSAQWGTFLGCVPADHLAEVCQIAGESPGLGNDFDCLKLYENLGNMLTTDGL